MNAAWRQMGKGRMGFWGGTSSAHRRADLSVEWVEQKRSLKFLEAASNLSLGGNKARRFPCDSERLEKFNGREVGGRVRDGDEELFKGSAPGPRAKEEGDAKNKVRNQFCRRRNRGTESHGVKPTAGVEDLEKFCGGGRGKVGKRYGGGFHVTIRRRSSNQLCIRGGYGTDGKKRCRGRSGGSSCFREG